MVWAWYAWCSLLSSWRFTKEATREFLGVRRTASFIHRLHVQLQEMNTPEHGGSFIIFIRNTPTKCLHLGRFFRFIPTSQALSPLLGSHMTSAVDNMTPHVKGEGSCNLIRMMRTHVVLANLSHQTFWKGIWIVCLVQS